MHLPPEFVQQTRALLGTDAYRALEAALEEEAPVSLRMNRAKPNPEVIGEPVPWASAGRYLSQRPAFTFDPMFHAGCYYVQEASSMFVEQVFRTYVTQPAVVLDLCAAPGGKSTHVLSLLPEGSLLVANEVVRTRAHVLTENIIKWGHPDVVVTHNEPAAFGELEGLFDGILADVPCSGEGMFRKDPAAVTEWSPDTVALCRQRQRRILSDVWPALKPGGLLIYSTCTFNAAENEGNVAWAARELGAEVLDVPVEATWKITGNLTDADFPVYRFLPHRTKGEGFFLAVLRKNENSFSRNNRKKSKPKEEKRRQPVPSVPPETKNWLKHPEAFRFERRGTEIEAFPKIHAAMYNRLRQTLHVLHAGIRVGECKGKDVIPHHSLAMSTALERAAFVEAELTYEQAVAYLRKEAIALDASVARGYVLLTYRKVPLGFAKNVGNRANNLYPSEWRIRSGFLPEEETEIG